MTQSTNGTHMRLLRKTTSTTGKYHLSSLKSSSDLKGPEDLIFPSDMHPSLLLARIIQYFTNRICPVP